MNDWKTTLAGFSAAILLAWQPLIEAWDGGPIQWNLLLRAALIAVLGKVAADSQPREKKRAH